MIPAYFSSPLVPCWIFLAVAVGEFLWPARSTPKAAGYRWFGNLALHLLSTALFMVPIIATFVAAASAQTFGFGFLDWLGLPSIAHGVVALLLLDALNYALHRFSHVVHFLWRVHSVHHSDPDVDITTMLRHHPLEIVIDAVLIGAAVFVTGITPDEVSVYIVLEWFVQSLGHANVTLPRQWDALLRHVFVTPSFHQGHHSRDRLETDSNYGQVLTIWDTLSQTATRAPSSQPFAFGLDDFREEKFQGIHWMLAQPFRNQTRDKTVPTRLSRTTAITR